MWLVLLCAALQAAAVSVVHPSWWVPDLVLAALVHAVWRRPARWLGPALLSGALTAGWASRGHAVLVLGYALAGWVSQRLARVLDADRLSLQAGTTALIAVGVTLSALLVDGAWSAALVGLAVTRVGLTVAAVPVLRRVAMHSPVIHE
jgi:hypothetical protein